ncbi:LamG-like jellyroll fold domain-containing protein [Flammeovirga sp. OC4]|uniref:LamG-like jellyroll fold domain-containing protein n=1 Tax=Flammeovirga sp. OC4 TaxID=1382345 RepID=UPI00155DCE1D|nr:LamG-like jellyroll fold domain-containing protein [Flammeovirga sp. OC4]
MNYLLLNLPTRRVKLLFLCCVLITNIGFGQNIFQHLSTHDPSTIKVDETNSVTEWIDLSGNENHAIPYFGSAIYPSANASFSNQYGIDFGAYINPEIEKDRSGLQLLSSEKGAELFDFTGVASTKTGFSVLVSFQVNKYHNNWSDLIGNTSNNSNNGFGIRYGTEGEFQIYLGGQVLNVPGAKALLNHSVVVACNYDAESGILTFWDSQNLLTQTLTVPKANFNFDHLYLGTFTNGNRQVNGMVGEVKIFDEALSAEEFKYEYSKMRDLWHRFILPVEIIGAENLVEQRSFSLTQAEVDAAQKIWMQINNLSYENKVSIKVNEGAWYDLNHASVEMPIQEKARGGMQHGGYNTIRVSIPAVGFKAGVNTMYFRFNHSDAISNGFRVVKFNLLDEVKENILSEDFFYDDDPELWVGPYTDDKSIQEGEELWREGALWSNYLKEDTKGFWYGYELLPHAPIQAKCADCHTQDGRDLELFSYSNKSIIERSVFHNLTEEEGRKVASYIRSLKDKHENVNRHGRPWNPPYQPGPSLKDKPIEYWAAGAGLEAVLDKDEDMLPYMFPNGVNEETVKDYFDQDKGEDRTVLPLALQFPDWKHWLPMVHPKDAFTKGTFYEDTYIDRTPYKNSQESLLNPEKGIEIIRDKIAELPKKGDGVTVDMNVLSEEQLADFRYAHEVFRYNFRFFQSQGGGQTKHWRSTKGNGLDALDDNVAQEFAGTSLARLMAVKNFEIMQEFNLQDQAEDYILGEDHPTSRQWFHGLSKHVFEVPAHITGCVDGNCQTFGDQPEETGQYESTVWYHLQAVLAGGEGQQWWNGPVDYNYQPMFILRSSKSSNLYQPLRYYHSLSTLYKTKTWSGDLTPNDGMGFRIRVQGPWYFFGKEGDGGKNNFHGFESGFWPGLLDDIQPGMTKLFLDAQLREFLKAVRKHDIASWDRWEEGMNGSNVLDPIEKSEVWDVTLSNDELSDGSEDEIGAPLWADHMYWVIGESIKFGVDCEIIRDLIAWSEEAWPNIDWSFEIKPQLKLKLNDNATFFSEVQYIEAIVSTEGEAASQYEWWINGEIASETSSRLESTLLAPGDVVVCRTISSSECLDFYTASDTLGLPGDLNIQMRINEEEWQTPQDLWACEGDQLEMKIGLEIAPIMWLDATAITDAKEGDRITTWEDQSSEGNDAVALNNSIAPVYSSNAMNGLPALAFGKEENETNSLRLFPSSKTTFLEEDFTVIMVHQIDPVSVWTNTICNKNSTDGDGVYFRVSDSGKFAIGGGSRTLSSSAYGLPHSSISTFSRQEDRMEMYTNGAKEFDLALDANEKLSNNEGLFLGQYSSSPNQNRHHKGYIAEVIVFDKKLSQSEQELIEGYLAHKWGLVEQLTSVSNFKFSSPLEMTVQSPTGQDYFFNQLKRTFSYPLNNEESFGKFKMISEFSSNEGVDFNINWSNHYFEQYEASYKIDDNMVQLGNTIEVTEGSEITLIPNSSTSEDYFWTSPSGVRYPSNENPVWTASLEHENNGIWTLEVLGDFCTNVENYVQITVTTVEKIDDNNGNVTAVDNDSMKTTVYPNPSDQVFTVKSSALNIKKIQVNNYLGLPLKTFDVNHKSITIDLKELNSGIYLLKMELDNGTIMYHKIIKK